MATMEKPRNKSQKRAKYKVDKPEQTTVSETVEEILVREQIIETAVEPQEKAESNEIVDKVNELTLKGENDECDPYRHGETSTEETNLTKREEEISVQATVPELTTDVNDLLISEKLNQATEDCKTLSNAVSAIVQPLPVSENSSVMSPTITVDKKSKENVKTYRELSSSLASTIKSDMNTLNKIKTPLSAFTMDDLQKIFGVSEMQFALKYALEFEKNELQPPSPSHPLYEALTEFQRARSLQIYNQRDVESLMSEISDKLNSIWHIQNCVERVGGRCADGCYLEETHSYQVATLQKLFLLETQKKLTSLREKATESHSQHSHMEYFLKYKIDDLLWVSSTYGVEAMRSSLRIIFWVLRTSGWGYDKTLRMQLRKWCSSLARKLLEADDSLENLLFLLHHILRISRGIKWSFHLLNCKVKSSADVANALCLLEAIVYAGDVGGQGIHAAQRQRCISEDAKGEYDVVVAADAMDDNVWFVVDSDGEGADLEAEGKGRSLLSETDVLGLLKQIPFEDLFKEIMVVRNNGHEVIFCGGNLNGGPIIRILASLRIILKIINTGLITYKCYHEVCKEFCRIALHCVKYFTDLWEAASLNCETQLVERVVTEYNNLFLATWNAIDCSGAKDTISMFQSEMPFRSVWLETVEKIYTIMDQKLSVSDNISCYYALVCVSNMAVYRTEEQFVVKVIRRLFEIGFVSDFSEFGCGEWARTLCGTALQSKPHLIGPLLAEAPVPKQPQWLESLPLSHWRPHTGEVIYLLNHYKQVSPNIIPHLLKGMNWSRHCLEYQTHRSVAIFLTVMSRHIEQPKGQYPEWIWECVMLLKLHMFDWGFDINSVPEPETITELDLSGRCHTSNILSIVMTKWGHSVPLIFQHAAPVLLKLANAGRLGEVVHALYYIVPILSECPDSIADCKVFKELLSVIVRNEKTYTKMATRLVAGEIVGPITKQLVLMMQSQLKHFSLFNFSTPRNMLMVWMHWLTSSDGWQADWVIIYLLDIALGSCFLHHDAVGTAANHLASFIQNPTAKSPTSSSGLSWLWNSNTYKGLVQCSVEAPYVWHATLWTEHSVMEKGSGLWQKLVARLATHKEGTKVNIDKALKSVGCSDSSSILVIYRCAQYGSSMSVSHPIFTLIWQLFFCLYLDVSILQFQEKKPVGTLFFEGMVNSRLLSKAKSKLLEAKTYHENKVLEYSDSHDLAQGVENQRQWYHESQKNLMSAFLSWLEEDMLSQYLEHTSHSQALPFYDKFYTLLTGNNTLWMDTVDYFQLNNFQPPVWPLPMMQLTNHRKNSARGSESTTQSPSLVQTRGKSPDTDPSSRIIHRLKSYERPIVESKEYGELKLRPLVDPILARDFSRIRDVMREHLRYVEIRARSYIESGKSLNATDNDLFDMVPNLYEKRQISRTVMLGCGSSCQGKLQLNVKVNDWRKNGDVVKMIEYNRTMYRLAIDDAMAPYEELALHMAIVSKLATMACEGKVVNVEENGPKMFNIVIDYIKEDIINFPTAHHTIICFATQLGEKFVTQNGEHFINLVCKVRGPEGAGLVGALLRPCQLSTSDMIRVYSAISSTVTDYHVAFSYLTKFNISAWLHNVRPNAVERAKFLNLLFSGLGTAGCEPSNERLILHELMCLHLTKVMAWEFPVHLVQVLTAMCNLSLEKKIPPDTWQHCITVIETYPNLLTNKLACDCLELVGKSWWSKRGSWGPNGLYGQYGIYCTQMGRLGALLLSTVLSTAMLYNPPLLTKDICIIVMKAMQTFWNVWLCPWWGGGAQASVWVGELCRGPALMPWGPRDDVHPDTMLDALVETIQYCATTLPGSLNELLSLTWQWYTNNFPHPAVNPYVIIRIHKVLLKLPWTGNTAHWITWPDLRLLFKLTSLNIDSCNEFALKCLGDRPWVHWIAQQPDHTHAMAVQILLPMILKLNPSKEVLTDAEFLPWVLMNVEMYGDNVTWFMRTLLNAGEPLSSNRLLPLLCAAGGLSGRAQYGEPWRGKRNILIRSLVTFVSDDESPSCIESVKFLLNRIQISVDALENSSDSQKYSEASSMLNATIPMLNMMKTTVLAEKVWCDWFNTVSRPCISAVVSSITQVNQRDRFSNLSEEALTVFFKQEGEWSFVISNWRNECVVAVDFLLNNKSLLTAMATYKASDRNNKVQTNTIHPIDKAALQALYSLEVGSSIEESASLWVCYIVTIVGDHSLDRANTFAVINQAVTILDKWAQEPSWGLFKAMGLVQNNAVSYRFRLLVRVALCFILDYQQKIKDVSPNMMNSDSNTRSKTMSQIESMLNQKSCVDIKHIIVKCVEFLKEQDRTIKESLKHIVELCHDLYSHVNFVKNLNSLFENVL